MPLERFLLWQEKPVRLCAKARTFVRNRSLGARVLRRPRFFWELSSNRDFAHSRGVPLSDLGFPQSMISSPPSKARRALCLFSYGIYADKFLFIGLLAHRVGKPPTPHYASQNVGEGDNEVVERAVFNFIMQFLSCMYTTPPPSRRWRATSPVSGRL